MANKHKSTRRDDTGEAPTFEEDYLDIDHWPYRWSRDPKDLSFGEGMNDLFKLFLAQLLEQKRPRKILRQYRENLCTLGEEIFRRLQDKPALRKTAPERLLIELLDDGGYTRSLPPMSPTDRRAFAAVCKALYRFLVPTLP